MNMIRSLVQRVSFLFKKEAPPVTLVLHREASGHIAVTAIGPCTPADALSVLERVHGELLRQMQPPAQ